MIVVELLVKLASLRLCKGRPGSKNPGTGPPQAYMTAVELLVELASLQTAFLTLDEAFKTTNRRVNALDNVVIPKLENTIAYIKARAPRRAAAFVAARVPACQSPVACHGRSVAQPCKRRLDSPRVGPGAAMCNPGQADANPAGSPCTKPGCRARATSPCQGPPWRRRLAVFLANRAPPHRPS